MVVAMLLGGAASADSVTVTADRLNIRKEADAASKVVGVVEKDDALSFVSEDNAWYQVKAGRETGYVMKQYVRLDQAAIAEDVAANTEVFTAEESGRATERVNMRELPMTGASITKVVPQNGKVAVIGRCGTWYQVRYDGKTGYIMSAYLTLTAEGGNASMDAFGQEQLYDAPKESRVTDRVNVRREPSTSAKIVKVVDKNGKISVLGEKGGWYKVSAGGKEGYIAKEYVALGLTRYDSALSASLKEEVNLRVSASTGSKILRVLKKGTEISVLGEADGWYQVKYDGLEGYIASEYVKLKEGGNSSSSALQSYPAARSAEVTDRVNMRKQASTSSGVAKVLNKNTAVSVLGEQGIFYQVKHGDTVGYIAKEYVKLGAASSDNNPSDQPNTSEPVTGGETLYPQAKAGVTTVTVNMRRAPEGEILHTLQPGTQVSRIGEIDGWYKVTYGGSTGYIAKAYVSDVANEPAVPPVTTPPVTGEGNTGYITAGSLNMRSGAGTNYGVIKVLTHGDEITWYSLENGWYLAKAGNDTGYVSAKYVSDTKPSSAPAVPGDTQPASGKAVLIDWWNGGIQSIFARGTVATVTDVDTGISWQVKRSGGTNHADVQPLTADDTAKMKQAYNGKWSWDRHAIWVTIGGVRYAASMNGMPHGTGSITTNNFDGHHCIHFLNSRTHTGNRLDAAHQSAVQKAYREGQ